MNLDALYALNCGMYILCSGWEGKFNGLIVNALTQVTAFPPQLVVSVNKESLTSTYIQKSGYFSVSVLEKNTPLPLIGLFGFRSGRDTDKLSQVKHRLGKTGMPIITEHTVAYLEAKVVNELDAGTHFVFLGEILETDFTEKGGEPMTYSYYRDIKGGRVPRTAATYHEETKEKERYRCQVCGYIYDSSFGDPDSGIKPGTLFSDLPPQWVCPICGASKDQFEKIQ
ncbi:flavin reductase [Candidatus Sordicultor fermentans]|uniref:flavin reductase n=1 Tax=Candidatus Sordicultor fermentans TaxID=1953203 RepID=UPI0016BB3858|nr:rubredoxin [Atribacterota bacterium]NLY05541.1 hypothetical protein [Candidatus Atribacteria bacterium]MDI9606854.1 rubredoxin [Atribacterota bacterium]MDY0135245.1 rubredoxin [Atribacterota bacterium]HOA99407.1 rubredoxin [Candidatus Atribacteria bacterium]